MRSDLRSSYAKNDYKPILVATVGITFTVFGQERRTKPPKLGAILFYDYGHQRNDCSSTSRSWLQCLTIDLF